ncbi:MAG: phosphotransferase [Metamycoplasmataceae bacterium]
MIKKILEENNITDLKLFYEGSHNKTYKGLLFDKTIQVRISKNKIVNHHNEIKLFEKVNNIIYIDESIMIREWINGNILDNNNLETLIKIRDTLLKHWELKIEGITFFKFDNNDYYNESEIVLVHGDLRNKNIIVNDKGEINFIDFEWVSYTSLYFDLAHLNLYCHFSIDQIVEVFMVDITKLKMAISNTAIFNSKWMEKY